MEAIKKAMLQMKKEQEKAQDKSYANELIYNEASIRMKKDEEEVADLEKNLALLEADYAQTEADLAKANKDLDDKETLLLQTEMKRNNLGNDFNGKDDKFEGIENNLKSTNDKLESTQRELDEANRLVNVLQSRAKSEAERQKKLELELKGVTTRAEEADKKIEEVCQKMSMVEEDIEFAEERNGNNELKILQLEEEAQVVRNNLKSLEVSQEMSRLAEIEFNETIKNLTDQLKKTEGRALFAERNVQKLMRDVDRLEDDLRIEREKISSISLEMEATIAELK